MAYTMILRLTLCAFATLLVLGSPVVAASGGLIVLNHDEWTLSNTGYSHAPAGADAFAANVATAFSGGPPGSFRAWSSNFGLTESSLAATMAAGGHAWTVSTAGTFDLATLQTYDGIFLMGPAAGIDPAVLVAYVDAGGHVYLGGGTGVGGAVAEADYWNPFLHPFGLAFSSPYNGVAGAITVMGSPHPVTSGVPSLFYNNGSPIFHDLTSPLLAVVAEHPQTQAPMVVVYDAHGATPPVPEMSTLVLAGAGLVALLGVVALRRRDA